jgi:hypothetical protein
MVRDLGGDEEVVRHHHVGPVEHQQMRGPESDLLHGPLGVAEGDVVVAADRLLDQQDDAGDEVLDDALQGEADADQQRAAGEQQRRDPHAQQVQRRHAPDDHHAIADELAQREDRAAPVGPARQASAHQVARQLCRREEPHQHRERRDALLPGQPLKRVGRLIRDVRSQLVLGHSNLLAHRLAPREARATMMAAPAHKSRCTTYSMHWRMNALSTPSGASA